MELKIFKYLRRSCITGVLTVDRKAILRPRVLTQSSERKGRGTGKPFSGNSNDSFSKGEYPGVKSESMNIVFCTEVRFTRY